MRALLSVSALLFLVVFTGCGEKISDEAPVRLDDMAAAERVTGLAMTDTERHLMQEDLTDLRHSYATLRALDLPNAAWPALLLSPEIVPGTVDGPAPIFSPVEAIDRPDNLDDLAFANVGQLSHLIRTRQVSCVELTELALARLEKFGPKLACVITLTPERARARARDLDRLLDRGQWLGPLHGIPFGAKDLLAVEGYPTTWGATPYKDQTLNETATVVKNLDAAGAVLVAKLTLGALAWGDVWFGGTTKNPWNLEQGSSGSSAGSASAVSAGLVPFAIGTETWGSIVSPSTRCYVTGLRPTYGRVSRQGAMALSWSMDKIGPIARTVEDCALVFDAIRGPDGLDPTLLDRPFSYTPGLDLTGLRVGYLKSVFDEEDDPLDQASLEILRDLDVDLIPVEMPHHRLGIDPSALAFILSAEAGAVFQNLTLSGDDDLLVRQVRYAWPNTFRQAQYIPAVEYIQANRARRQIMAGMAEMFTDIDVYVTPSFGGDNLLVTNLTGHPQVVVPNGFDADGDNHSISFVGDLFDEAAVLKVARAYQEASLWHDQHPKGYELD